MPSPAIISSPISTARLLLEPVRSEFAPALFTHFNDWEVMRWLAAPPWPYRLDDMQGWVAKACAARAEGRDADYAITLSGVPIGGIGVTGLALGPVLGYWLARPFWGRGYMSEAADALVDRLFADSYGFVASGVIEGNAASLRVQEKLGFRVVNERYIHSRPHGRLMPHLDTVLGRTRWSHLRCAA
ncbi:MAG: GNAT family N-acetyltransferase [Hyphomicrobiales bacterium]